jgi:putative serine protease PepD
VLVPVWALVGVGALVLLLVGGIVGYAIGDNANDGTRATGAPAFRGRIAPFPGFGSGNGNGNGSPNGGNGNGNNGGSNGGSNGPSAPSGNGAFLGVAVQTSTDPQGAELVTVQPGSAAADAGLRTGDVVTKVDSASIEDAAALGTVIRKHDVGDKVDVTYTRSGTSKTVGVTLGDRTPTSTN